MNKIRIFAIVVSCLFIFTNAHEPDSTSKGWVSLFDGKSLNGWKVGHNASTFSVDSGCIVVHGPTAHLYYVGDVENHEFKNFEFKAEVKTMPGSNSGIYFHTQYQEGGWPDHGYEVQVNNSHSDDVRTGSLYDVVDVKELYVKDYQWFTEYIKVVGKHVIIKINDTVVVDYTEPVHPLRNIQDHPFRYISKGTFALQGHDPNSIVYFKNIRVRNLGN
ncbi:MAG: DUF1080 domain-containing protein [Bacteroidetes bacterium]|nr:DUF1080 domain-containing protein [Bacteroidota bacterium]